MTSTWIIRDWMGNDCDLYGKKEFKDFGDARAEIEKFAADLCDTAVKNGKYSADSQEYEDAYSGICDDLYAINVDENGKEIADDGQYTV